MRPDSPPNMWTNLSDPLLSSLSRSELLIMSQEYPYAPPSWIKQADFGDDEIYVQERAVCPECGSHDLELAIAEQPVVDVDGLEVSTDEGDQAGQVALCHACNTWTPVNLLDSEARDSDDESENRKVDYKKDSDEGDSERREVRRAATEPFSFQGAAAVPGSAKGIAVRPDTQSVSEIEALLGPLLTPIEQEQVYVQEQYQQQGLGDKPYSYDNPFVNRGGGTKEALVPEDFRGDQFIIVCNVSDVEDMWLFSHERCGGVIAATGGTTAHAVVVARGEDLPAITDAGPAVNNITPGDMIEMVVDAHSGVAYAHVNGGDPNFTPGEALIAREVDFRFIWQESDQHFDFRDLRGIVDTNAEAYLHDTMINNHPNWDFVTGTPGVIYNDGTAEYYQDFGDPSNMEARLRQEFPHITAVELQTWDTPVVAKVAEHDAEVGKALECPECGSHTIRPVDIQDHTGTFQCVNCKATFDHQILRPEGKTAAGFDKGTRVVITRPELKGQRGSILSDSGTDENFDDDLYDILLDNGEELKKVPESAFKKIKSANVEEDLWVEAAVELPEDVFDGIDDGRLGSGYEGHPVMCYMCGNSRNASLGGRCEHCGYVLTVRRDGPPANDAPVWKKSMKIADTLDADVEVDKWYSMYSPRFSVPDVIHIIEMGEDQITAHIEGDDKGLFPVTITRDELEAMKYRFEPYTPHEAKEAAIPGPDEGYYSCEDCGAWIENGKEYCVMCGKYNTPPQIESKVARKSFTEKQQKALIDENPKGIARNFDKIDIEGTHYTPDQLEEKSSFVSEEDDLVNRYFFLW